MICTALLTTSGCLLVGNKALRPIGVHSPFNADSLLISSSQESGLYLSDVLKHTDLLQQ